MASTKGRPTDARHEACALSSYALYGGAVELRFDRQKHVYTVDDEVVPNVTTITGVIAKQGLADWSMRLALEYVKGCALKAARALNEVELEAILGDAARASDRVRDESGAIGRSTHQWIERHIGRQIESGLPSWGQPVEPLPSHAGVRAAVEAFLEWELEAQPTYLASERKVFSREHHYTGTTDAIALIRGTLVDAWREAKRGRVMEAIKGLKKRRVLLDFKTSNRVFVEAHLQTVAYDIAVSEEEGVRSDDRVILHLPKEAGKKARPIVCGDYETDREAFLAVRRVYRRIFNR
jgi:hypothetical protein